MVASVPELTKRTFSIAGKASITSSARSASVGVEAPKLVPLRAAWTMASMTSGWRVAEDQRPPGADVVDVAVAVGVPHVRAQAADQKRRRAADRTEGADRRIDSAGNELLSAGLQCAGFVKTAGHGSLFAFREFALRFSALNVKQRSLSG